MVYQYAMTNKMYKGELYNLMEESSFEQNLDVSNLYR